MPTTLSDWLELASRLLAIAGRVLLQQAQSHPWATAVALYGLARAFGIVVQSGHRGVLFRWGRAVKELEPGFHWLIPLVHGTKVTPVRSVTINLDDQKVMTADGLVYDVGVNVVYHVEHATLAMTRVDQVDVGCRNAIPIIVTEVIHRRTQAELLERDTLDQELSARIHAWVARWGLVVEQAGFTSIAPNRSVLATTQLRFKVDERALTLQALRAGGLDWEVALILVGSERRPVGTSRLAYRRNLRAAGHKPRARRVRPPAPAAPPAVPVATPKQEPKTAVDVA